MQIGIREITPPLPQVTGDELLPRGAGASEDKHLATAKKFETLIATQMVKELRRGMPNGFFGDGPGADVYNGWLDSRLGESLAANWDIDLAGMVKTNLDSKQARLESALEEMQGDAR